ncbi:MAG: prepilin peptidase [bacterium]|nr:prepilin peptidase [bacterium]
MEEIIVVVLGLVMGSFMNVLIYRLPEEKSIVKPASHCPNCKTPVKFYDNIPVLSYVILAGKCRHCKTGISPLYPMVELFTGFAFWLSYVYFAPNTVHVGFSCLFVFILITLAVIDFQHHILPNELTIGGSVIFFIYAPFHPEITWMNAYAAALGSAIFLLALYIFYIKVRKIEGLGQGDIKMVLLLGAFLGVHKLVVAIVVASLSGLLVGLILIIFKGKNLKFQLPFGTFLSLGSFAALFWGHDILRFLQSLHR